MTTLQWRRILELYEATCDLPPDAARQFLGNTAEDAEVLTEVRRMLDLLYLGSSSRNIASPNIDPDYAGLSISRYDVVALIGRGSNGLVYSGRDRELSRPVALKFMSPESAGSGSAAARFLREAQAASALNHPHIVTIHEVSTWQTAPVIVMELIEGRTLRSFCGSEPLPLAQVRHLGGQFLRALAFAHEHGIVHRDFKPENVMVRPDGYLKILDLGLARGAFPGGESNLSSLVGLPVGTLRYMSPEQCRGETATSASDVFAAGIVLYEMIAGVHPFRSASALDTAHAIANTEPPPLRNSPASVAGLIHRMLAKDPASRPTAEAAAAALALEADSDTPSLPSRGRYWTVAVTVALVLVAVLLWGSFASHSGRGTQPPTALKLFPLASLLGAERQPSASPDGQNVAFAFSEDRSTASHIYVKSIAGGHLTRLTSDALPDFFPAFSSDGSRVAFLRRAGAHFRVMVSPARGGMEQQIGEVQYTDGPFALMAWHPDGRHVFVVDASSETRMDLALFSIALDNGARQQITFPGHGESDAMPVMSPDNRRLGFARLNEASRGDIFTVPLEGGALQQLTHTSERFFSWTWSRTGNDLLICYRRQDRVSLYRQPVAGGSAIREPGLDDQIREVSLARDTGLLVYGPGLEDDLNVWRYPIPPAIDPPKPLIASASFDGDARFSPDGRRIAFASDRSGQSNLWICASDGSDPQQLTVLASGGHIAGSPNWSPDGRWLAFDWRAPDSASSIFILDLLGGKPKRLTGPGPSDLVPSWSRDSHWVYFASHRSGPLQIWKVPSTGGTAVQVTRNGGFESFESADRRFLYYTKGGVRPGFWRMAIEGGPESFVPELASVADRNWQATDEGLYFLAKSPTAILNYYSFADGRVSRLSELPGQPPAVYRGLAVAADRRSILYLQADTARSNLTVVQHLP